jgi:hypothetical protein
LAPIGELMQAQGEAVATGTVLVGGPQMGGSRSDPPNRLSTLAEAGIDKPLRQRPLKLLIRLESRLQAP